MKNYSRLTKKTQVTCILLLTGLFSLAQPKTKTIPHTGISPVTHEDYPAGSTKTITVTNEENLDKVIRVEIKDDKGIVHVVETWTSKIDGRIEFKAEGRTASGKVVTEFSIIMDNKGNLAYYCLKYKNRSDGNKEVIEVTKNASGEWVNKNTGKPVSEGMGEELSRYQSKMRDAFNDLEKKVIPDPEPLKSPCDQDQSGTCSPKSEVFVGYSVLSGDRGTENVFFPVGGHASAVFFLNDHIALGPDASIHSKKDGDQTLTRGFLLGRAQYSFGETDNCNKDFQVNTHLLAGICFEKFNYKIGGMDYGSKGNGFTFGAGVGGSYKISEKLDISLQAAVLAVKFENTDDLNAHLRVSAGIMFKWYRNFYEPKKK
mgnify:CR=1 FL=1